ncbi:Tc5 transposase DNA-binding domain-containing protein [Hirsutella rhossiliensis]
MVEAILDITDNGLSQHQAAQKWEYPRGLFPAECESQIRACVTAVLKQEGRESYLGVHWVVKFIRCHPELKNKIGRRQEANRFNSFTPKAVHWYFDIREKEYGWIKPENTVNVDEGGITSGFGLDSLEDGSSDPKRKALLKGPQLGLSFWMDIEVMQRTIGWLRAS